MNGHETETRREGKLVKDLMLHSDISKSSRNSENTSKSQLLSAKKDLGRLHCHLLLLLRNGVGRQSQKRCDANSTQCSQAVTHPSTD